jgi:hypothetical protein
MAQANRLHRAVPQRLPSAFGHHFDGQATVEIRHLFPVLELVQVSSQQGIDEGVVLILVHRTVQVIGAIAGWSDLVIARLRPDDIHVDAVFVHDGGNRIEEGQCILAGKRLDAGCQSRGGQGTCGDDDIVPLGRRQALDFGPIGGDIGVTFDGGGDRCREAVAIDRERSAGGQGIGVGHLHDQRAAAPHFLMQQPDGVLVFVVGAETIGAHQLRQTVGLVRIGATNGAHFV